MDDTTTGAAERVLEVARGVLADLDLEVVLERVLVAARELTGARYAALGVLDDDRSRLERFITSGMDEETRRAIGPLPAGRGVLGELISHPLPLRLADVGAHPHSYGFPMGHPPMRSFLGVPVLIDGAPYGNLYLTEKGDGTPFEEADEHAVVVLAELAAVAIDHARRYAGVEADRAALRRTVDALDATLQIGTALGGQTDLDTILELVAKRGRALVQARALVIEHLRGDGLVIAAVAGEVPHELIGEFLDAERSVAGSAMRSLTTQRLEDEPNRARFERHGMGRMGFDVRAGLVVPLAFRGRAYGALVALDRLEDGPAFSDQDRRLLEGFAASAATAIATAEHVASERHQQRLTAAEQERARWARELHDETLQSLGALRLSLALALRGADHEAVVEIVGAAVHQLDTDIVTLRDLITDLRPAALDDLGLAPAIDALLARVRSAGMEVDVSLELSEEDGGGAQRLAPELELVIYRTVQEALTNARKHGGAKRAVVEVREGDDAVELTVRDDGAGFDPAAATSGFGLLGMRERVELADGSLEVRSAPGAGTTVSARVPVRRRGGRRTAAA